VKSVPWWNLLGFLLVGNGVKAAGGSRADGPGPSAGMLGPKVAIQNNRRIFF
jgi:hypothetical protein